MFLFLVGFASAIPQTQLEYFHSSTCSHCAKVATSGILDNLSSMKNVTLNKYEVALPTNREKYLGFIKKFGIKESGIPFLVINQSGKLSYLMGDGQIIKDSKSAIINFHPSKIGNGNFMDKGLSLWVVIAAALIDSINPCAFGVLLFLMTVLLTMGSAKRALRSGIIYTFVILLVYLAAGFGIMQAITSLSILNEVKIVAGFLVLIGGIIELKDFFWEGKGFSLRIPAKVRPMLEKYIHKSTLSALIILGALVAMVELPCTGGIYLAILSLIAESGTKGIIYLIIYNIIFVSPLILITYAIYRGAKVEAINIWVQTNKRFMRLAAGIIMLFLSASLLGLL